MIDLEEAVLDLQTCITMTPNNNFILNDAPIKNDEWREGTNVTLEPWDNKFILIQPSMPNISGMINLFDYGFDTDKLESYIQSRWDALQRQTGLKFDTVPTHKDKIKLIAENIPTLEQQEDINLDQLKDFLSLVKNTMQLGHPRNKEEDIQQIQKEISYDMINIVCNNPPEKEQTQTNAEKNKLGSDLTTTWITIEQLINHALNLL